MRNNQTLIEDMISLGGNVLGNLLGARHELKAQTKQRVESLTRQLDLVTRSEFDAAFAMLAKARAMQEDLHERLVAIEAQLNPTSARKAAKPVKSAKTSLPSVKKSKRNSKRK